MSKSRGPARPSVLRRVSRPRETLLRAVKELGVLAEVEGHRGGGRAGGEEGEGLALPEPAAADERARARVPAARQVARRDLRQVGGRRLPHALAPGGDRRGSRPERRLLAERDLDALLERLPLLGAGEEGEREQGDGEAPAARHDRLRPRTRRPAGVATPRMKTSITAATRSSSRSPRIR